MIFLLWRILIGKTCYLAIDDEKSFKENSFERKFKSKQYTKDSKLKENIKINKCNFDIDKRGGLKLVLLDNYVDLQYIIDNDIDYEIFIENTKEFVPISAFKENENMLTMWRIGGYLTDFSTKHYMLLDNEYLKYKSKYVLWDGVVQKVKFSHFIVYSFDSSVCEYKNYDEIPQEYIDIDEIDCVYEIIPEENEQDSECNCKCNQS